MKSTIVMFATTAVSLVSARAVASRTSLTIAMLSTVCSSGELAFEMMLSKSLIMFSASSTVIWPYYERKKFIGNLCILSSMHRYVDYAYLLITIIPKLT